MAKKVIGKPFPKGVSGNPGGRPQLTEETKKLRKLTNEKLEEIADLILAGDKPQLQKIAASLTEPAIRVIYAKAACNAMVKGDVSTLELILNRLLGKVRDKVEHSGEQGFRIVVEDYGVKK